MLRPIAWSLFTALVALGATTARLRYGPVVLLQYAIQFIALTLPFTLFAVFRLTQRKKDAVVETHEDFLAYPQTSPEIYGWLPYHKDTPEEQRQQAASGMMEQPDAGGVPRRAEALSTEKQATEAVDD